MSSNMAAGVEESLEDLIDRATNPNNNESNAIHAERFSNQVNREFDGPCNALRLIVNKLQAHQEIISLQALSVLETCVQNCGKKFHQEIGKYRFLNELIKLLSPKYDGGITPEVVKKRIIALFYSWYIGLPHEGKIAEAYKMLKQQGVIERDPQDPQYQLASYASRPRDTVFEDEEKSKLLASLLRSSNPEDLQAANRLIKTMVRQEEERLEKVSKRIQELETVANNVRLLSDMMKNFSPTMSQSDRELMKDLYETCLNMRPQLFRLAGASADDKDDSIGDILKASDDLTQVIDEYKAKVLLQTVGGQPKPAAETVQPSAADPREVPSSESSLLDLGLDVNVPVSKSTENVTASTLVNDQFKLLGLDSPTNTNVPNTSINQVAPPFQQASTAGLFSSMPSQPPQQTQASSFGQFQMGHMHPQAAVNNINPQMGAFRPNFSQFPVAQNPMAPQTTMVPMLRPPGGTPVRMQGNPMPSAQQQPISQPPRMSGRGKDTGPPKAFDVLDFDVFSSFKNESGQDAAPAPAAPIASESPQVLATSTTTGALTQSTTNAVQSNTGNALDESPAVSDGLISIGSVATPATVSPPSDVKKDEIPVEIPDVSSDGYSVPQDAIQPTNVAPVNVYDKNGIRTVIHAAKDSRPTANPNVAILVLSTMSTSTSPVKQFSVQAAVPKSMRVKLQPPSGSELPGYNPLLPPTAITQVMLIANPRKDKIKIRFLLRYQVDGNTVTETANVENYTNT